MQIEGFNTDLLREFGKIVNALRFSTQNLTQQRLLITSALVGEGKTISAMGIAYTMALRNKKVLLIDINLHNSSISRLFGIGTRVGLKEVLQNRGELGETLYKNPEVKNLCVLGAGNGNIEPFEILSGKSTREFLNKIKNLFDFIIIDSPALEVAFDALLIVPHVEACVMVVQAEKTERGAVLRARDQIEQAGGKILGIIFNREKKRIPKIFRRWI